MGKVGGRARPPRRDAAAGDGQDQQVEGRRRTGRLDRPAGRRADPLLPPSTHYRRPIDFSEERIRTKSRPAWRRSTRFFKRYQRITGESFYDLHARHPPEPRASSTPADDPLLPNVVRERRRSFLDKMDDDFNTGGAIGACSTWSARSTSSSTTRNWKTPGGPTERGSPPSDRGAATLRELAAILGLFRQPPQAPGRESDELAGQADGAADRAAGRLRKKKDFATADRIRNAPGRIGRDARRSQERHGVGGRL